MKPHRPISLILVSIGLFLITFSAHAQSQYIKGCLDELIDWNDPWTLTLGKIKNVAETVPKRRGETTHIACVNSFGQTYAYIIGNDSFTRTDPVTHAKVNLSAEKLSLFMGTVEIKYMWINFEEEKVSEIVVQIGDSRPGGKRVTQTTVKKIKEELARVTADSAPKQTMRTRSKVGHPLDPLFPGLEWRGRSCRVILEENYSGLNTKKPLGTYRLTILPLDGK